MQLVVMSLDHLDQRILDILQTDCTRSHADIGDQIGLSGSAVRRRIAALIQEKVIDRQVAILRPGAAQSGITLIVSVSFERETRDAYDAFRAQMRRDPHVLQCYATAGTSDFVLIVAARSPADYEAWNEATLMSNKHIRRSDSTVVWSQVKFTTKRPVFD